MRIHRLEVSAFGPFSGTETVDFDALNDAGLFLLCGPTGSGKTSILDAVCFGLYGEVPGDRNSARRLRSDHAAPSVPPAVVLETTLSGRRFRLRRSPAWTRPKRRGDGTTTEQARVTLEELVGSEWVHLSSRLDETGQLVSDLLGMNVTQFTQVAMLPQGRFQSFLRARSDERHKVLQRLFRTSRFEDIERWLVSRRQVLKTTDQTHQETVASAVSRLSEAADSALPEDWEPHDLSLPADSGALGRWAEDLRVAATAARQDALTACAAAQGRAQGARTRLDEARAAVALRARHAQAQDVARSLDADREGADRSQARLDAARRAASVSPLVRVAAAAADHADKAQLGLSRALSRAAEALGQEPAGLTQDDLAAAEQSAKESAAVARALLPREAEMKAARSTVEAATDALRTVHAKAAELEPLAESLPARIAESRAWLTEQVALAAGLEAGEAQAQLVRDQLAAAERLAGLGEECTRARLRMQQRTDTAQQLRERMQDVREARITGMAAELASALASGDMCPVCGSCEHPSPARPVEGAPTKSDEESARTAYENADLARQDAAEEVATLEQRAALEEQSCSGRSVGELQRELQEVVERSQVCRAAQLERDRTVERLDQLERQLAEVREGIEESRAEVVRLEAERAQARSTVDRVSAELSRLFDADGEEGDVARLVEARSEAGSLFAVAREALQAYETAAARAREAGRDAEDWALEHGFTDADDAAAAALTPSEIGDLESALRRRQEQQAQVRAVLSDPEVQAAVAADDPRVGDLESEVRVAEEEVTAWSARTQLLDSRVRRLERLQSELEEELAAWAPTREAYAVARAVSTFAEGKGGDNALQMRLSAYVLASRLKQVVAAANERLGAMSDERYTLDHSAVRGVGELRGGLSLMVRDEWTGESRDPATLSGGETFVVSLALALGLADVVTGEAGGSGIDTLFIDEGFGTLDPETLDDVMDTLDGLRDGGRVVGIVSHVPEMRTRVAAQLQVRKERTGSRVVAAREAV